MDKTFSGKAISTSGRSWCYENRGDMSQSSNSVSFTRAQSHAITTSLTRILWVLLFVATTSLGNTWIHLNGDDLQICPFDSATFSPETPAPRFAASACEKVQFDDIDPQGNAFWIRASFHLPKELLAPSPQTTDKHSHSPLVLTLLGKTSSSVYLNGYHLGDNGLPSDHPSIEQTGKMDFRLPIPASFLKEGKNELSIALSAHHGWFKLGRPLHVIAITDPRASLPMRPQHVNILLVILGALLICMLYFVTLSIVSRVKKALVLISLMLAFSSLQLLAELSRSLFQYNYPLHDLRLLAITISALGFGLVFLKYHAEKLHINKPNIWFISSALATIVVVLLLPGFDAKTAFSIILPVSISGATAAYTAIKKPRLNNFILAAFYTAIALSGIANITDFHDSVFYYLLATLIVYLITDQARTLAHEREQRAEEQKQIEKLKFVLDNKKQIKDDTRISVSYSGKTEFIATCDMIYCQASGDYVEIHTDTKMRLFSGSMKTLEAQLPSTFMRVHRSYLVNLIHVESLSTSSSSQSNNGMLSLTSGKDIPVSRRIMPSVRSVISSS